MEGAQSSVLRKWLDSYSTFCKTIEKNTGVFLHEFVVMPDHFHLIITPAESVSLEKAVQYIKGGFSFRAKRELNYRFLIWQESFTNHRLRDADDYANHREYIHENPVEARLVKKASDYPYSSAYPGAAIDPVPPWLKPRSWSRSLRGPGKGCSSTVSRSKREEKLQGLSRGLAVSASGLAISAI